MIKAELHLIVTDEGMQVKTYGQPWELIGLADYGIMVARRMVLNEMEKAKDILPEEPKELK